MAGMPEFESQVRADSFQVSRPTINTSEAEGLFRMAAGAQQVASQIARDTERTAVDAATREGAGVMVYEQQADGTQRLRPLDQLLSVPLGSANRAFNDAVLRNYMGAVETDARGAFGQLQTQHMNDPASFAAAAQGYIQRTVEAMPQAARGMANTQLNSLATAFSTSITERVNRGRVEQMVATTARGLQDAADDIDRLSASNPADARIAPAREALRQRIADAQVLFPDRINDQTAAQMLRTVDLTVERNRLTSEAIGVYRRGGGLQAAERHLEQYAHRSDIPWTTEERDQLVRRAQGAVRDLQSQAQTARALDRQQQADVVERQVRRGAIEALGRDPRDTTAGERRAGELAAEAPRQDTRDQIYLALMNPVAAERWRQSHAQQDAIQAMTAMQMSQRNAQDVAAGRSPSFPLTHMMQTLPPQHWPAAEAAIQRAQAQQDERARDFTSLTGEVTLARNGQGAITADRASTYVEGMFTVSATDQRRRAADMGNPTERLAVAELARDLGVLPRQLTASIDAGLGPSASFEAARVTSQLFATLIADPARRAQIESQLGSKVTQIEQNARDIRQIIEDPNLVDPRTGQRDAGRTEAAWAAVRNRREANARMTGEQQAAVLTQIYGQNASTVLMADLRRSVAETERPNASVYDPTIGASVFLNGAELNTGTPTGDPFLMRIPGTNLRIPGALFGAGSGERVVPVDLSDEAMTMGPGQAFRRGVEQAIAIGERDREALRTAGMREVNREYQPTYFGSAWPDRAVLAQNAPEAVGARLGLTPRDITEQLALFVSGVERAYQAAGQPLPVRTPGDPLRAIVEKDYYLSVQRGTDGNPQYVLMYRPAAASGQVQDHRPVFFVPGMQGTSLRWNERDVVTFQMRPRDMTSQDARQEAEIVQREAARRVNTGQPGVDGASRELAMWWARLSVRLERSLGQTPPPAPAPGAQPAARPMPFRDPLPRRNPPGGP